MSLLITVERYIEHLNSPVNNGQELWLDSCLEEYNSNFGDSRKYHQGNVPEDYDPGYFVEFEENGTAWPHSRCGTNYITGAVTPWEKSPFYS